MYHSPRRTVVTTLGSHGSWWLMHKHDWPTGVADGSDEWTDCEADFAAAVSRIKACVGQDD